MERESMQFDVVIVGGGPSGLSAAIRLKQLGLTRGKKYLFACLRKRLKLERTYYPVPL